MKFKTASLLSLIPVILTACAVRTEIQKGAFGAQAGVMTGKRSGEPAAGISPSTSVSSDSAADQPPPPPVSDGAGAEPQWNVIFLTLDGVRYQEFFERPGHLRKFFLAKKPQVGFPKLWETVAQDIHNQLWIYGDPANNEGMKISNPWAISLPGYQSIFAGESQGTLCKNNGCPQITADTFPERLIREGFERKDVASIASWEGIAKAVESHPGTIFSNFSRQPLNEPEYSDLNDAVAADPTPWPGSRYDKYTGVYALRYIQKNHPRFIHIGFDDSDEYGHRKDYESYVKSLNQYDDYIQELMKMLHESGAYGSHTALVITTDHGRGTGPFWITHSKELISAHQSWAVVKMPAAYLGAQKSREKKFEHADLRPTFETLLGVGPLERRTGKLLYENRIPVEMVERLRELRSQTRTWTSFCENPAGGQPFMSHGSCPFGDMTLFAGISCLSGEKARCQDVKNAQDSSGRWWRSPGTLGHDGKVTFSRDQGLGVLAYLIATHDTEAALRWQHYIQTEGHKLVLCKQGHGICDIDPGFYNLMYAVWGELGLDRTFLMGLSQIIPPGLKSIETLISPKGYHHHLIGVHLMIRQHLAHAHDESTFAGEHLTAKTLAKANPLNPFFKYLRDGPTQEAAQLVLDHCPRQRLKPAEEMDWSWQRKDFDKAWENASGHDCIFMVNLLIGPESSSL
ncbi:MAG: alkaline phosphatase family protein [Methylotenera sp.]|nr:alkaline phosphatase family protein [Oligoflexia bacterium]